LRTSITPWVIDDPYVYDHQLNLLKYFYVTIHNNIINNNNENWLLKQILYYRFVA